MGGLSSKGDTEQKFNVILADTNLQPQKKAVFAISPTTLQMEVEGEQTHAWELRFLRIFGYDKNIFRFEFGRRQNDSQIYVVITPKVILVFLLCVSLCFLVVFHLFLFV